MTNADADPVEHDDGPERQAPVRTCVATRERLPIDALIRFVAAPDGTVTPDIRRRLPGRGVWVKADRASVDLAIKRKAFARGLKSAVVTPGDLGELTGRLLEADALQALAIANKAGALVFGHAKVEAAIEKAAIRAICHASDAAPDGMRKIGQALKRRFGDGPMPIVIAPFSSTQMSLCLGREHVIHICLVNSPASESALAKCLLFLRYRGSPGIPGTVQPDWAFGSESSDPGLLLMNQSDP